LTGHYLDWEHQPLVYKHYPGMDPVLLPQDVHGPENTLSFILKNPDIPKSPIAVDLASLSLVLRLTYGVTAKARHSGGDFYYRSVASAGALYPAEIYVATHGVNHLSDGIYHFSVARHGLSLVRKGNLSSLIQKNTEILDTTAPLLTFFTTAIFFRSAWKYRERSYRYHLLDTGHVVENLILALNALGLPSTFSMDFNDGQINRLLGVDEKREVCLAVCKVPGADGYDLETAREIMDLGDGLRNASRVSEKEIDYPAIQEIHRAGVALASQAGSIPLRLHELGPVPGKWKRIAAPDPWPETINYVDAVFQRRSRRNFVKRPISKACLMALLDGLCAGQAAASEERGAYPYQSVCSGFLVANAEGWDPGVYLLDTASRSHARVHHGSVVDRMAHICLDQMWTAHAAVHFVFMSNLEVVDRIWGPRGYRYAMMTAGRLGERLYLMATAMGLGCCGIGAFYDIEAATLLGLNPASRLLYLVAVGPVKSTQLN